MQRMDLMTRRTGQIERSKGNPASLRPDPEERRKLRRSEGIALSLIAAMMTGAWVMMLSL